MHLWLSWSWHLWLPWLSWSWHPILKYLALFSDIMPATKTWMYKHIYFNLPPPPQLWHKTAYNIFPFFVQCCEVGIGWACVTDWPKVNQQPSMAGNSKLNVLDPGQTFFYTTLALIWKFLNNLSSVRNQLSLCCLSFQCELQIAHIILLSSVLPS